MRLQEESFCVIVATLSVPFMCSYIMLLTLAQKSPSNVEMRLNCLNWILRIVIPYLSQ